MFVPSDKLLQDLECRRSIFDGSKITVNEVILPNAAQASCLIEVVIEDKNFYYELSRLIQAFEKVDSSFNILKIELWTYEMFVIKGKKLFKCSFFTRSFDKDLRSWLRERMISKVTVKERDMYNTAKSLAELVTQLRNISVNINPIKREFFVVAMNKIFYVPYIFLADIFQAADIGSKMNEKVGKYVRPKNFRDSMTSPKRGMRDSVGSPNKFPNMRKSTGSPDKRFELKGVNFTQMVKSTIPEKKELDKEYIEKISHIFAGTRVKKDLSPIKPMSSSTGLRSTLSTSEGKRKSIISSSQSSIAQKLEEKTKQKEQKIIDLERQRIYDMGILIMLMAENNYYDGYDENELLTEVKFNQLEKKFCKNFSQLVQSMLVKDPERRPTLNDVRESIKTIIKLKGTDEFMGYTFDNKEKAKKFGHRHEEHPDSPKFLFFFPHLYEKLILVYLTPKIYYENIELNIDFIIPSDHRSLSVPNMPNFDLGIFLLGGSSSNKTYVLNEKTKSLDPLDNMISLFERKCFGLCRVRNFIIVAGGIKDGDITNSSESFNFYENKWKQLANMNEACSELSLCRFGEKYVYKFGGILEEKTLSQTIERYDIDKNKWTLIEVSFEKKSMPDNFAIMKSPCAIQVTDTELFIFGGVNAYNEGTSQTFFLNTIPGLDKSLKKKDQPLVFEPSKRNDVTLINTFKLPTKMTFEMCAPAIVDNQIHMLQKVKMNFSRVVVFNGESWQELKDINW